MPEALQFAAFSALHVCPACVACCANSLQAAMVNPPEPAALSKAMSSSSGMLVNARDDAQPASLPPAWFHAAWHWGPVLGSAPLLLGSGHAAVCVVRSRAAPEAC